MKVLFISSTGTVPGTRYGTRYRYPATVLQCPVPSLLLLTQPSKVPKSCFSFCMLIVCRLTVSSRHATPFKQQKSQTSSKDETLGSCFNHEINIWLAIAISLYGEGQSGSEADPTPDCWLEKVFSRTIPWFCDHIGQHII